MGTCTGLLVVGLSILYPNSDFTEDHYARVKGHGIWTKYAKEPGSGLAAFRRCLCTYAERQVKERSLLALLSPDMFL